MSRDDFTESPRSRQNVIDKLKLKIFASVCAYGPLKDVLLFVLLCFWKYKCLTFYLSYILLGQGKSIEIKHSNCAFKNQRRKSKVFHVWNCSSTAPYPNLLRLESYRSAATPLFDLGLICTKYDKILCSSVS